MRGLRPVEVCLSGSGAPRGALTDSELPLWQEIHAAAPPPLLRRRPTSAYREADSMALPSASPSSSVSSRRGAAVGALMVQDSRSGCLGRPVRGKLLVYIGSDMADAAP